MAREIVLPEEETSQANSRDSARSESSQVSVLDLLTILAERKRLVFSVTAVFAIVAVIVSLILPKRYTATATILPPQQNTSLASALTAQLGSMGGAGLAALAGGGSSIGLKNPNDMLVAMMKSRTVEDAMVQHFKLMQEYRAKYPSDARKALEHFTKIDGSGKDGLIHISIEDSTPERAKELTNGYLDQFQNLSEHLAITEASQRRLFFERQLEDAKNNLANAEEEMKKTEQRTGLIQLDSQARALIESAASLRAQITSKEVQIKSLETFATDQNGQLVQAEQELESLRAQLAKLGGSESDPDASLIVTKGQVSEAGVEYVRRLRDVKYYETIFDILARQFEIAKLDEAKEGALIQVVDTAVAPDKRSSPHRGLIVIIATVAGFFIGSTAAIFIAGFERLQDDVATREKFHMLRRAISFRSSRI